MAIQCRKCKSGKAYLNPTYETLDDGTVEQVVKCLNCGERHSRPMLKKSTRDLTQPEKQRQKMPVRTHHRSAVNPCPVVGCKNRYADYSPHKMCRKHTAAVTSYNNSKKTNPPPIIENAEGQLIENPANPRYMQKLKSGVLPESARQILDTAIDLGYSYREISEIIKCTENHIRMIHRKWASGSLHVQAYNIVTYLGPHVEADQERRA